MEIKFRAWVTLPQREPYMEYPTKPGGDLNPSIAIQLNGNILQLDENFINITAKPAMLYLPGQVTLLQYTGLKDRGGEELYDGDIFECDSEWYRIGWDEDSLAWMAYGLHGLEDMSLEQFYGTPSWKQGNIYENPELLVSTKEGSS